MKTILNCINEAEEATKNKEELNNITDLFLKLYERLDDNDKEMCCIEFMRTTIDNASNKDRMIEAWEYCAKEILHQ
jgi:hypothetical protein